MKGIEITGAWLRRRSDNTEMLVEIDGKWRLIATEPFDSNFSHIVEPLGMERAKPDPLTGVTRK